MRVSLLLPPECTVATRVGDWSGKRRFGGRAHEKARVASSGHRKRSPTAISRETMLATRSSPSTSKGPGALPGRGSQLWRSFQMSSTDSTQTGPACAPIEKRIESVGRLW